LLLLLILAREIQVDKPEIVIVDTIASHINEMAKVMREQSANTARNLGFSPRRLLWKTYKQSLICRTVFINEKIGAIFGIGGILFGEVGQPWLIMSDEVNDFPFKVAFIYRRELKKFQNMFPILEDYVDETDKKSIRMLELMKFNVSKNTISIGDVTLRRAERRA